ncbi:MAG: AsmA-like C-terminal region-containing protein [Candidatus Omnitrophota bacterium]
MRTRIASELSKALEHPVNIGSVSYVPFQSISLDHVTISSKDGSGNILIGINNVTTALDVLSLIKDKQLKTTMILDGLHSGDLLCNATLRTLSRKAPTHAEIFDPALIYSVSIIEAVAGSPSFTFRDIFGILEIDKMSISSGKIRLTHNNIKYLTDFTRQDIKDLGYDITVRSDNLGFTTSLIKDEDNLTIDKLTGMFYTLRFDLKGEVRDFRGDDFKCSVGGTINTELETFAAMPGEIGKFARRYPMAGSVESNLFFSATEMDLKKCEIRSTISATNFSIDKIRIKELMTKISVTDGRLDAPLINGVIYGGTIIGKLKMDLFEKDLPFMFSFDLNNMDFERLLYDLNGNKDNVYGNFQLNLDLKGYATDIDTTEGTGTVTISDADLGLMPLLTPLLGDVYAAAQRFVPVIKPVKIDNASMAFEIKHRRIETNDLVLLGEDISINGEGYMDFDGQLNVLFENRLLGPPSEEDEEWPIALRNAIVSFGRFLGKTRLTGTLKEPKWTK